MHDDRFDDLSRQLWQDETRRRLLRRFAALPMVGAVGAFLARTDAFAAGNPALGIQLHTEKNHDAKRRRKKQRRDAKRRRHRRRAGKECVVQDQVCIPFIGTSCCSSMECRVTAAAVTTCQLACSSTTECQEKLKMTSVECIADAIGCPSLDKCCRPLLCNFNSDCKGGVCCRTAAQQNRCCAPGQHCAPGGGCAG